MVFSEEALPKGKGEYILGYYGNNYSSITGVTEPFQVSSFLLGTSAGGKAHWGAPCRWGWGVQGGGCCAGYKGHHGGGEEMEGDREGSSGGVS